MEFDAEGKSGSGRVPDFGAIFMSNCSTKKECLRKKVFGLPSNQASFVRNVSDGTFLFLFEYEKRELYGVFQASCDGAMNIVPDAFKSVGKHFPAQICFRTIWICDPLPEYDFRDAIKDNYYSKYKFNFGLSEDQVDRLLWLFKPRILKDLRTPILVTRTKISKHFKISNWDSRFLKTYREENNLNVDSGKPYDVARKHGLPIPRDENDLKLDGSIEPFDVSENHGFPRPNIDFSGYSNKFILDKNDSILRGYHRLSTGNHLEEPLVSNFFDSKSHGDAIIPSSQPLGTPGVDFRNPESPGVQYLQSLSFRQGSCSMGLADSIHPSEGQLVYSHAEPCNEKLSQSRCHNLDGSTKLGDFIPLSLSLDHYEPSSSGIPFSGAEYLQNKTIGMTNLEYEGLSSPDNLMPFIRNGDLGRANTKSSCVAFIPDNSSPCVSDYGLSAASRPDYAYEVSRYQRYEASTASASFSSRLHLPKDGNHLESQNYGYYENGDPSYGNNDQISMGLYCDNQKKRRSVFSRLCEVPPGTGRLRDSYGYIADMMSEDLKVLHHDYSSPKETIWKPRPFVSRQDNDENFENTAQNEMIDVALPNEEDGWSSEEVAELTPLISFKRRSEVRKVPRETKANGYNEGGKCKKRKLVRPTFSPILQRSPQEICNSNENEGSESEDKLKSYGLSARGGGGEVNRKDTSENDCIQNAGCPVSSKGNNGFEHCSGSEDSKVEKLCRELFGNSCSCPKCEGSSQEICEDNTNAGSGEPLIKSNGDKMIDKGLSLNCWNAKCHLSN